jgi:predicted dinucleotide-binding enzyme
MKIGVLGTGNVGKAIGRGFLALGHDVKMGARDANSEKAVAWAREAGGKASHGTFADAAQFGEIAVLATLGMANHSVIGAAGTPAFAGKVVIDTTNPLVPSDGPVPKLGIFGEDSSGEQVQRLLPNAKVVKAFNTVGNAHMFKPDFPGGPPDMFIAGNDAHAKETVTKILTDFGWNTVDAGDIRASRLLEAMCVLWCEVGMRSGNWNQAFKLLKK